MNDLTQAEHAPRRRRIILGWCGGVALALALAAGAAWWYLHSQWFQRQMESLVKGKIAAATGARAQMGYFHLSLRPLGIEMRGLVLHGRETAGQPPLARIGEVRLGLTVRSFLGAQVSLTTVQIDQPDIHIEWLAPGLTNLPHPASAGKAGPPAEGLFQLGIRRLLARQGLLHLQDREIPFTFRLRHLHLQLRYTQAHYRGRLRFSGRHWQYRQRTLGPLQARLRFSLWPNDLKIRRGILTGHGARIRMAAMAQDLSRPKVSGQIWAQLHPRQIWAQWLGPQDSPLAGGIAFVHAKFAWQAGSWSAHGGLAAQGLRAAAGPTPKAWGAWSAQARFTANPRRIEIAPLILHGLGGLARLRLSDALAAGARTKYQVQGKLAGLRILPMLQMGLAWARRSAGPRTARPRMPKIAGRLRGSFALSSGTNLTRSLRARIDLHIAPTGAQALAATAGFAAGQPSNPAATLRPTAPIPLQGELQLQLGPGWQTGDAKRIQLTIPGASLSASGPWDRSGMHLQVRFQSQQLAQLPPWLRLAGLNAPPVSGQAQFSGALSGRLTAPSLSGRLLAEHLASGQWRVDQAAINGAVGPDRLQIASARLRMGAARLAGKGSLQLRHYRPRANGALTLAATVSQLPLGAAEKMLGRQAPVQGTANLQLRLRGSLRQPEGRGHLQLTQVVAFGQPVRAFAAGFTLHAGTLTAAPLRITLPAAVITGEFRYNLAQKKYQVRLASAGIRLQDLPPLQSARLRISGLLRFHLQGAGTLAHPAGQLRVEGVDLRGNGEPLGQFGANLTVAHQIARLDGTDTLPGGDLHMTAVLGLGPQYLINARIELLRYDADAWLRRFTPLHLTGHSQFTGALTLQGPLRQPQYLVAQASFTQARVKAQGLTLFNAGPLEFSINRDLFTINQFHLLGTDTDLKASGTMGLHGAKPIRAALHGAINLAILHALNHHIQSAGRLSLDTRIAGDLRHPQPQGTIQIQDGSVAESGIPIAFDHVQSRIGFTGQRATIEQFTAHAGGGTLRAQGFAAYTASGLNYDFTLHGGNLRVLYAGVSATGDARLHLSGTGESGLLSGDIVLNRMALTPNFDLAVFLANQRGMQASSSGHSPLGKLKLAVHLVTGPGLQVASSGAQVQAQANLRLQGTLANPVVLGHITGTEGSLRFAGNRFTVDRADLDFADPFAINPLLNVVLSTTVQYYNITLSISGPMDKLTVNYRSDPPLSNPDIIALLATGQTAEQSTYASMSQQASSGFMGQSEQLLSAALENVAASRVRRIFGITRISVNPNAANVYTGASSGAITIEQQISPQLSFTYTQNLSSNSQNIVRISWNINPHFSILISRDEFGIYGVSFHFRQRAR